MLPPAQILTILSRCCQWVTVSSNLRREYHGEQSPHLSCGVLFPSYFSLTPLSASRSFLLSVATTHVPLLLHTHTHTHRHAEAIKAMKQLQGAELEGHTLELKLSSRKSKPAATAAARRTGTVVKGANPKLLVRNVAFEATKKELRQLFAPYGDVKSIRLPPKSTGDGQHRGCVCACVCVCVCVCACVCVFVCFFMHELELHVLLTSNLFLLPSPFVRAWQLGLRLSSMRPKRKPRLRLTHSLAPHISTGEG